jgi:RHS repeat-associated protein
MSIVADVTRAYDAENRMTSETQARSYVAGVYTYNADGQRVRRKVAVAGQPAVETWQVYGFDGELLAEYAKQGAATAPQKEYGYRNGQLLLTAEPKDGNPNLQWLVTDQLGTPRMIFDKTGSLAGVKRHDYLPFGEEIFADTGGRTTTMGYTPPGNSAADGVRQKFTQKERDNETGLDYFLARYYSSTQGRFTSADEFTGGPDEYYEFHDLASDNPTFYADLTDPQSLNKYQYCYNNPLLYIDLNGHQGVREWFRKTLNGAASTVSEDNGFGRMDAPQTATGRGIGHVISIVQGGAEIVGGVAGMDAGAGEAIVTAPAAGTGAGIVVPAVGVVTAGVGAIVTVHGAAVVVKTFANIFSKDSSGQSQSGSQQPYENTPENEERMRQGKSPVGRDGKPVELHHPEQKPNGPVREMTRTDHRGPGNMGRNHPNRGPSQINRSQAAAERRRHWKEKVKN